MVTLKLSKEEQNILIKTLDGYLSELRMEISNTEKWEYKAGLKNDESVLNRILDELRKGK
jgi:hypothetical protein